MVETGLKPLENGLAFSGIKNCFEAHWNLTPPELVQQAILNSEGQLTSSGALMCDTGKFTGRSPKDRFIVEDSTTKDTIWWGDINIPISEGHFNSLHKRMLEHLENKKNIHS